MAGLVVLHHLDDRTAAQVTGRQIDQMLVQMGLHLALGFDHEAQVPAVAAQPGQGADGVAAGVPQRVEQARAAVQLAQPGGAPGQVVGLFLGGFQQVFTRGQVAGHRRLAEIQALRADLADVVAPHQARRVAALGAVHARLVGIRGRVGAGRRRVAEHRVQGALRLGQQVVQRGGLAECGHGGTGGAGRARFSPGPAALPPRGQGRLAPGGQGAYNPASYASPFHNAWQSSGEPFAAMSPT
ncbi:hypothetical protein G6F57_016065 [Rhizopus arrhizus]|nr:hypothetical protein G6F57_016065 [Rhizopus arrhizus]